MTATLFTVTTSTRPRMAEENEITLLGERLVMLPERALFWSAERTLLVSDPEFGRAASFHKSRTIVQSMRSDLDRLGSLIERVSAERVIFVGDLLHARGGSEDNIAAMTGWFEEYSGVEFALLRANPKEVPKKRNPYVKSEPVPDHPSLPQEWPLIYLDSPSVSAPFMLTNEVITSAVGYVLAGGQHPGMTLVRTGKNRGALFPCFYFGMTTGMIPAFGATTGLNAVTLAPRDRVIVAAGDRLVNV